MTNWIWLALLKYWQKITNSITVFPHICNMLATLFLIKLILWCTIGPISFLFGTAQFSYWAIGAANYDYIVTNSINSLLIV